MKKKLLVLVVYLLFLVILLEGSARAFFSIPMVQARLMDHDIGWRNWWVARHKESGKDIYYKFDVHDPLTGWRSKPGLRDMQVFDNKILNTNSKGLRGTREFSYEKTPGVTRILILGDSFTFGDEVSDHETYSHYLQTLLPDTEVINFGVHGYGHDQMLILLQEEGTRYMPDIVILGFLQLDMSRNMLKFRDFAKPMFELDDGLVLTGVPVPTPEEVMDDDWYRPRVLDLYAAIKHKIRNMSGEYVREKDEKTMAILETVAATAGEIGAVPLFVFLPTGAGISENKGLLWGEEYLFSLCERVEQAECLSSRPHFAAKLAAGETFKTVNHWGPAGHRTVAEAIGDYLLSSGYLDRTDPGTGRDASQSEPGPPGEMIP